MQETSDTTKSMSILDKCEYIKAKFDSIERDLQKAPKQYDSFSNNPSGFNFASLEHYVNEIKLDPESANPRNATQVGLVQRRLEETKNKYQKVTSESRKHARADAARLDDISSYTAEDPVGRAFQQNVGRSGRYNQVYSARGHNERRHQEVSDIERDVVEIAEVMQEFSKIVQQQESSVGYIEQNGERTHKNVEGAKEYLGKANENARSRNRAKWWCLIILLLVVIAVAIIVVIIITRARATKA